MKHADFMNFVRKHNSDVDNPTSRGAMLRKRIMHESHTDDEWLALRKELNAFIALTPPKSELDQLQGCSESLIMICNGIEDKRRHSIITTLKDDSEYQEIRTIWKEVFDTNVPPYNYDEYGGIEDYKTKLKRIIKEKH